VTGPGALYAGATSGVFTSADRGVTWYDYSAGLPNVELRHLLWTEGDLFAVTHGRGIWHHGRYDMFRVPVVPHRASGVHRLVLCSNCHRMIHRFDDPPDIDRFRSLIRLRE
jgi:hypothetical protein